MTSPKAECGAHEPQGFLRRAGAARFCGVSVRTLSDWQRRRIVPFVKITHKICLFKRSDLERALGRFRVNAVGDKNE